MEERWIVPVCHCRINIATGFRFQDVHEYVCFGYVTATTHYNFAGIQMLSIDI